MSSGRLSDQTPPHAVPLSFRPFRRLAIALAAGALLAGCSVDGLLTAPGDPASVGSITPPAPIGTASSGYRAPAAPPPSQGGGRVGAATFSAAASQGERAVSPAPIPASASEDDATLTSDAPGRQPGMVSVMDTDRVVEGDTRDPVVAGVGTGHPVAVSGERRAGTTLPAVDATGTEIYQGPPGQGTPPRPLALPPGAPQAHAATDRKPVEVAALPRPVSPAGEAESARPAPVEPAVPAPQSTWQGEGGMPASEVACRQELKRLGVTYQDIPRISNGPACGIAWPIKVTALSGGIRVKPAATLNCPVTAEFAKWVKADLAPAARMRYLSGISSITQLSSYSCRTMNSQRGAPMSEHAHGNAIDIGAITLNSGRTIEVRKPGWFAFRKRGFLNKVRAESCERFTTVLGPGSNKYHWNHFHFDLRHRKSGRSYCE